MRAHFCRSPAHVQQCLHVAWTEMTAHRDARDAKRKHRRELRKPRIRLLAPG
jgi:hypothetical protein